MSVKVYFDLDGTLYDLYGMPNWLEMLQNEQEGVFLKGSAIKTFDNLVIPVHSFLLDIGVQFGVISWLPMQASPEYEEICRREKLQWIEQNLPFVSEIAIIPYGTPKQNAIRKRAQKMYLIDDNIEVCKIWDTNKQRKSIHVYETFSVIDALEQIYLEIIEGEVIK